MFPTMMSNSISFSDKGSTSSITRVQDFGSLISPMCQSSQQPQKTKKKRNLPRDPDSGIEVIALSPGSLMAKNHFFCEICNKGFPRDQNLQLHRRGHNIPWKLKQRNDKELIKKKVYVCPVSTCIHHQPSRALGDLTGIKKHYFRKHGEKKWKCDKCPKTYAVQSDLKAHSKICVTNKYRCSCGIIFSRIDNLTSHVEDCDALAEQSVRFTAATTNNNYNTATPATSHFNHQILSSSTALYPYPPISWVPPPQQNPNLNYLMTSLSGNIPPLSTTVLLHAVAVDHMRSNVDMGMTASCQNNDTFTQDFLGLTKEQTSGFGSCGASSSSETKLQDTNTGRQ